MTSEIIRDSKNNIIGFVEEHDNKIIGKDKSGAVLGYYDKNQNITVDKKTGFKDDGNNLISLIYAKALEGKIFMQNNPII